MANPNKAGLAARSRKTITVEERQVSGYAEQEQLADEFAAKYPRPRYAIKRAVNWRKNRQGERWKVFWVRVYDRG